jgi:hypothetical protein
MGVTRSAMLSRIGVQRGGSRRPRPRRYPRAVIHERLQSAPRLATCCTSALSRKTAGPMTVRTLSNAAPPTSPRRPHRRSGVSPSFWRKNMAPTSGACWRRWRPACRRRMPIPLWRPEAPAHARATVCDQVHLAVSRFGVCPLGDCTDGNSATQTRALVRRPCLAKRHHTCTSGRKKAVHRRWAHAQQVFAYRLAAR